MNFTFKNVGFIDEGDVELGELTVICGRNNTGKTYLSHSIYGLLEKCKSSSCNIAKPHHIDSLLSDGECEIEVPNVCDVLKKVSEEFSRNSLDDVFNSTEDFFEGSEVLLSIGDECNEQFIAHEADFTLVLGEESGTELRVSTTNGSNSIVLNLINGYEVSKSLINFALKRELNRLVLNPVIPSSFVITSERTGASMFYKDLDSQAHSLIDQLMELKDNRKLDPFKFIHKMRSRYSLPIRNNIDNMRYAQEKSKKKSYFAEEKEFEHIFTQLKKVVGGSFKHIDSGLFYMPLKKRNRDKIQLPIHLASSATKSLYLLDLYLRSIAKKNDVLIIDEPELNLHPDAQRQLARLLARIINAGTKVVITTHSDHLIRELNVLIMLSNPDIEEEDKEAIFSKHKIQNVDLLKPHQIKAYVSSSQNHKVHSMEVSKLGIHMDLFNDEINESSNLSNEIYYLIP